MGLFDLFKGKRDDEDALSAMRAGSDSSLASPDQVMAAGGLAEVNVADDIPNIGVALAAIEGNPWLRMFGLDEKIIEAVKAGNVQISQMPTQTIDMRGSGAREQVLGVLGEHGIDAHAAEGGGQIDISDNAELQQQILGVLEQFGIDPTPADRGD